MDTKWSKTYLADLLERVISVALYGVVTMLTADASGAISGSGRQWWLIVGLPAALSLIKGLLANLANPESGPSALPAPPAPEVNEAGFMRLPFVGASRDRSLPGKRRIRARRRH